MQTQRDDSSAAREEPFEDEVFEKEDLLLGKGMRPMLHVEMINFLHWLKREHPEITRIRNVSERQWRQIAQEAGIHAKLLLASVAALTDTAFHDDNYDRVRSEQTKLGF